MQLVRIGKECVYLVRTTPLCSSEPMKNYKKERNKLIGQETHLAKQELEGFLLTREKKHCTYRTPAAAGPTALKIDIKVTLIPFATPLCSCLYTFFHQRSKNIAKMAQRKCHETNTIVGI